MEGLWYEGFSNESVAMDIISILQAVVMGVVEGATEFIPVSSTGHLILAGEILGFSGPQNEVFDVVIQLGAILAVVALYFEKLWSVLIGLPTEVKARKFAMAVLLAFLPSAVLGFILHDFIKGYLFSPVVVCISLVVGGIAILFVEKHQPKHKVNTVEGMSARMALKIGAAQCLSLIPGVSRSGATILGAMMVGVERKTAAEFSFFLAIPTMMGASALDLWKARDVLDFNALGLISVGFVVSFVVALLVVKWLVGFVGRQGFGPFAWYRITLGIIGLALILAQRSGVAL